MWTQIGRWIDRCMYITKCIDFTNFWSRIYGPKYISNEKVTLKIKVTGKTCSYHKVSSSCSLCYWHKPITHQRISIACLNKIKSSCVYKASALKTLSLTLLGDVGDLYAPSNFTSSSHWTKGYMGFKIFCCLSNNAQNVFTADLTSLTHCSAIHIWLVYGCRKDKFYMFL
jgi:hypothetical protein